MPLAMEAWKKALTYPAPPKIKERIKTKLEAETKAQEKK
jgi:hypothetical protein